MPGPCSSPNGDAALTRNRTVTLCGVHKELRHCDAYCRHTVVQVRENLRNRGRLITGKTAARRARRSAS